MAKQLFTNNASSELSGTLPQAGTTLVLAAGTGSRFPAPVAPDYFIATLFERDEVGNEINIEIVKVTARTADTLTIERDFESVVGVAGGYSYPSSVGKTVYVELRWTAYAAGNVLQASANLAELSDPSAARTNLGLGNVNNTADANKPVSTAQAAADTAILNAAKEDATTKANTAQANAIAASTPAAHATNTANPHAVTKAQVGLDNVDNTSDANKPVSTAQQAALNLKAPIASPTFTGTLTHFGDVVLSGSFKVITPAGLGYGPGAGGTVTQATSKSTTVTLNKPSGRITMHAASLAANTAVSFVMANNTVANTDTVAVNLQSKAQADAQYVVSTSASPGSILFIVRNMYSDALAEAVVINFAVIKGAVS